MTKANAGYRALAPGEGEPNHVVPLARFGAAPAPAGPIPAGERFNPFRDRQPAMPASQARSLQDAVAKASLHVEAAAKAVSPRMEPEQPAAVATGPASADMSPWVRNEILPASVLFDLSGFNDVLRFLVDRYVLEKRRGDIFIHVRSATPVPGEMQPVLSFVEPAKSALAADLVAALIATRRAAGHEITVVQPPEDHEDFGFWQRFARAE